jgi:hypothetical protein
MIIIRYTRLICRDDKPLTRAGHRPGSDQLERGIEPMQQAALRIISVQSTCQSPSE